MDFIQAKYKEELHGIIEKWQAEIHGVIGIPVIVNIQIFPTALNERAIRSAVCDASGLSWEDVTSRIKQRDIVHARHLYCYCNRIMLNSNLKDIASNVGYNDHSDVINAINTTKDLLDTGYKPVLTLYNEITKTLLNERKV